VEKEAGGAPFAAVFSVAKTKDYDGERLQYELNFGDETPPLLIQGKVATARGGVMAVAEKMLKKHELDSIVHVFQRPGTYEVTLKVTDNEGDFKTTKLKVNVGNEPPEVRWDLAGKNRSFYQPNDQLHYQLVVNDAEDGSLQQGAIPATAVATTIDYLETGFDITSIAQGHQSAKQQTEYARGKMLMERSDCKTCHAEDRVVNGPAFQAVADRYRGNEFAVRNLSKKVLKGGAGVWGQTVMSAHPQISEEDAGEMVRWILSLGSAPKPKQSLPLTGVYPLLIPPSKDPKKPSKPGTFILKASYRDRGSGSQAPLENSETIALRPAFQQAEQADSMSREVRTYRPFNGDTVVLNDLKNNGFFVFKHTDLTGIHSIAMGIGMSDSKYEYVGGRVEIRLDSPKGKLVGKADIPSKSATGKMTFADIAAPITNPGDGKFHDLYFVLKNENSPSGAVGAVDWVRFDLTVGF
jgi:cytochrome c